MILRPQGRPAALKIRCLAAVVLLSATSMAPGQVSGQTALAAWTASWISDPMASPVAAGVYHFRKEFELSTKPETFPIRISADNRYRLFVNGVEVANGPARGDVLHWHYESLDIAAHLRAGRNVIAAQVWNMGEFRPAAQVSLRTALVIQGDSPKAAVVDTGRNWKVLASRAYSFKRVEGEDTGGFYVAGPREDMVASLYPWGWELPGFDASAWPDATPIVQQFASPVALARGTQANGSAAEWQLVPRSIPLPEQTPTRFATVRIADGVAVSPDFVRGNKPLVIPAHSKASILLDQGTLTIG